MSGLGNKAIMAKNIKYYMELNLVDRNKLCADLGIKYTTLCDWLNAKTYPRIDKIEMMADYFNIQKADLVEDRKELYKIRLFTGSEDAFRILKEKNPDSIVKPGVRFVNADGTEQNFDVTSLVYSIMESVSEMPPEQLELVNNMVGGKKIIKVENPYNKKPSRFSELNAAHARTDIEISDADIKHDDDIMDDENF